jgi:hypothetical protein
MMDVFVRDRQTGQTTRISVSSSGQAGNANSENPAISADGRFVAFSSDADNLVTSDSNEIRDVFVHDRQTGQTELVSLSSTGQSGNAGSYNPSINNNSGRWVTFVSQATNLVAGDTNTFADVFLHDRVTKTTLRASVSSAGIQGNFHSESGGEPAISADGLVVVFESAASNFVSGDTNAGQDIFVNANILAASLVPPRNYFTALPFTLTWSRLSWATAYEIQVATSASFALPLAHNALVPGGTPAATITALPNGDYYWRVRAQSSDGLWGAWSDPDMLTLAGP